MPKNKQFWTVRKIVAKVADEFGLRLSHRELHRVANAYLQLLDAESDLLQYDPKNYADPTGELAVRDWFDHWLRRDLSEVAA